MTFRAVLFDWRGTLAVTLTEEEWVRAALRHLGRPGPGELVAEVAARLQRAEAELDAPGTDSDAVEHRRTYLHAIESDPVLNVFADDVPETLRDLQALGVRVGIVSDVHVDIRPAFAAAGLAGFVDAFVLSFEQGVQKPAARCFARALELLGVAPDETLMVGDRPGPDGGAVEHGLTTLLLPPLTGVGDRRLRLVTALCAASPASSHT